VIVAAATRRRGLEISAHGRFSECVELCERTEEQRLQQMKMLARRGCESPLRPVWCARVWEGKAPGGGPAIVNLDFAVRPDGGDHQWRRVPTRQ
jgi:hypothetical protein